MANFNDFTRNFTNNIERAVRESFDTAYLNQTGSQIVKQIQVRTRAGFGVARNNARQQRLRPLSRPYVELRQFARGVGILSNSTTPRRSNLTFTGNMLESIIHRVNRNSITFGFSNPDAIRVAEEVQSRGRPFFNLSSTEIRKLTRQFNQRLRTFLIRI